MKKKIDCIETIESLAQYTAENYFNNTTKENYEDRKRNGLGCAIAQWSGYDGIKILEILGYALEDANFHDEHEKIQKMIDKLKRNR